MTTKETDFVKEVPLNLELPNSLKLSPITKLFIYIPNFKNIKMSEGKNFENGFWSISFEELKKINFLLSKNIQSFQFLIIHKNPSEEEIVSNAYYQNDKFYLGPFITAEYTIINETSINLRIKCLCNPSDTKFEIAGIPDNSILSFGKKVSDDTWIVDNLHSKNLLLKLNDIERKKIYLSITGINKNNPHFNTTFNLIINIKEASLPYKTKYKEIKIPALEILQKTRLQFDRYILSIKNPPENCCVDNCKFLENKYIINNDKNKEIRLEYFNLDEKELFITLEYILINNGLPTSENTYTQKVKCDLENAPIKTKDFTKCITCKALPKCKLFKAFMDYIGYSTMLRHIIPK